MTTQTPTETAIQIINDYAQETWPQVLKGSMGIAIKDAIESALAAERERWKALEAAATDTARMIEVLCGSCMASLHPHDFNLPVLKAALAATGGGEEKE